MARKGIARVRSAAALESAWARAAGDLAAQHTRVAGIKRGRLEIIVSHSTLVQELSFQKQGLLEALRTALPDERIEDLRFRLGPVT